MEQLRLLRAISRHRHAGWPEIASRLSKTTEECKAVFESVAQQPPDLTRMDLAALKQLENRIYQEKSHELMVALADLEGQYCTLTQISSVPEPMEPTTPVIHPIQQDELMDIDISSSALQANSSSTILSTEANSIATAEAPITEITTPSAPVRTMKHPSPKKRGAKGKAAGKAAAAKPTVLDSPGKRSDFGAITDTDNDSDVGPERKKQRLHDKWKRAAMMICQKFADHRAGYSFLKSIKDDNYALAVKFPMCLDMVRSRIRDGRITNIPELHRDLLLMVSNAIMFNPENSDISEMASEMMQSIDFELHSFLVHHKLST